MQNVRGLQENQKTTYSSRDTKCEKHKAARETNVKDEGKRLQEKQKREAIQKNTLHITVPNAMKLMNEKWVNDEESCQITKNLLDAVLFFTPTLATSDTKK